MQIIAYVVGQTVLLFLSLAQTALFIRAILSWLPGTEDSGLQRFLVMVTEPLLLPARALLHALHVDESLPIDLAFLVTVLGVSFLQMLLVSRSYN